MTSPRRPAPGLSLLLILRPSAPGAVALTGVEAISDGVPAFKTPEWRNARTTLTWAALIFGVLFLGDRLPGRRRSASCPTPTEQETVLSQLARHVMGDGPYLFLVADLDGAAPGAGRQHQLRRLPAPARASWPATGSCHASSPSAASGWPSPPGSWPSPDWRWLLIIGFGAKVSALIPLYTLGVFLAFTLSQAGMLVRWWRRRERGWQIGIVITASGTLTTFLVLLVVGVSNFTRGAWLIMILVPVVMWILLQIHRHYVALHAALDIDQIAPGKEVAAEPIVIVPIARLDRPARQAIAFANSISRHAVAVHVTNDPATAEALRERWPEWAGTTELVVVESPYRALVGPLLAYMDALGKQAPNRPIVVVLNEVVPRHWWENLLHNQTALRLKLRLFSRRNTIVADVPYHLD